MVAAADSPRKPTPRTVYVDDEIALDADGEFLCAYDDVEILRDLAPTDKGNCEELPKVIPAGTIATAILLLDGPTGLFDLECYLGERHFAFAQDTSRNLRVVRRREDKKRHVED